MSWKDYKEYVVLFGIALIIVFFIKLLVAAQVSESVIIKGECPIEEVQERPAQINNCGQGCQVIGDWIHDTMPTRQWQEMVDECKVTCGG